MLEIYNSLTQRKEAFVPLEASRVRLYVCGMTVYDYCHLGHARAMVVFDAVVRYLRHTGYRVDFVRNITDVDDKIMARAAELGESIDTVTERFIAAMYEDADALACLRPDREPRATEHMGVIIDLIQRLLDAGYAYQADNGDIYYAVARFAGYGKLSGERVEALRAGARVEPGAHKRDPVDFALWKASGGESPSWSAPWGQGRPGWHIECSAMASHCLGERFDIHGGGLDLKFPHHDNEIAQSEAAFGADWVRYWMHNGHVRIDEEKMSKSLGNFFTVRDILAVYPAEVLRYFLLMSHYRSPLNYTAAALENARAGLARLYLAVRGLPQAEAAGGEALAERFEAAMADDFNTPEALAALFELARDLNRAREREDSLAPALAARLRRLGAVLGLLQADADWFLKSGRGAVTEAWINRLIGERDDARRQRDFARADAVRDELAAAGVVLEDSAAGTTWRRG